MLQRLRSLYRRPATALLAALAVSTGSSLGTSAQQPARTGSSQIQPSVSRQAAPKGALLPVNAMQRLHVQSQFGRMPLQFEQNLGQAPAPIRFLSLHGAYEVALTPDQLVLNLKDRGVGSRKGDGLISMRLLGGNPRPVLTGEEELPGKVNYFLGNKREKWHTGVSTFSRVRLKEVYPGIDLVYYGNQKQLEYDFVLKPGVDPAKVQLSFSGNRSMRLQANGDLLLRAKAGEMRWKRPDVYQMIDGKRRIVAARYSIRSERKGASHVGFEIAKYDHNCPLVIDPALLIRYYDTLSSPNGRIASAGNNFIVETGNSPLVVDSSGNVYAAATSFVSSATYATATSVGGAASTSTVNFAKFPNTTNSTAYLIVMKMNSAGVILYSDIIGGGTIDTTRAFHDTASGITIDASGNAYLLGSVQSPSMPMAGSSYQTYIGFPANTTNTSGATNVHSATNAYIAKLNAAGSSLVYASYFGGRITESGTAIAVNSAGSVLYVGGFTPTCNNFPATGGRVDNSPIANNTLNGNGFQTAFGGSGSDGYLARLDDSGGGTAYNNLTYVTLMGGEGPDNLMNIAIDPADGNTVYCVGTTNRSNQGNTTFFHGLANGFQTAFGGQEDGYLVKVNTSLTGTNSFKYGTFFGGTVTSASASAVSRALGVATAGNGIVYVVGQTNSVDFPTTANALQSSHGGLSANTKDDAFLVKVDTTITGASSQLYASYLGGGGKDEAYAVVYDGTSVYVAGMTESTAAIGAFPTTAGALFSSNQGGGTSQDGFIAKFTETNAATHAHQMVFSTYLGTSLDDLITGIDIDPSGNIYVMGDVLEGTFPSVFFSKISVNHPPVANAQSVTVIRNTAKAITLTATDADGDTLTYTVTANPSHGTLSGTAPNLTYTPTAGYLGADSFQFKANDGHDDSNITTITLTVIGAPTANSQTVSVAHNAATAITLTGSDPNTPPLSLTYNVTSFPTHGTLSGTAPNLTYTPSAGYSGSDSFQFTVTNTASITSSAATVTLNVAAAAPTANVQTVTVSHNTAKAITLSGSDPNVPALTPLTFAVTVSPLHGVLTGTAPNLTYTPSAGYSGSDSFQFNVTNTANITSSAATVTLNIAAAAPTANAQSVSTNQDSAVGFTLTGSDPNNPALALTYNVTTSPTHGALSGSAPNLTYTPNAGYSGPDSFQFTVTNSVGLTSAAAAVSITVAQTVVDVTAQVSISRGPFLYRRSTGTYIQVLTLTNTGGTAITGPISCILTSLANATLANASGTTSAILPAGLPYINAGAGGLTVGASVNVTLSFTRTGAGGITYSIQVVDGPGSR